MFIFKKGILGNIFTQINIHWLSTKMLIQLIVINKVVYNNNASVAYIFATSNVTQ